MLLERQKLVPATGVGERTTPVDGAGHARADFHQSGADLTEAASFSVSFRKWDGHARRQGAFANALRPSRTRKGRTLSEVGRRRNRSGRKACRVCDFVD